MTPAESTAARRMQASRAMRPAPRHLARHLPEPDYSRPLLQVDPAQRDRIIRHLTTLYGPVRANACYVEIERLMRVYYAHKTPELIEADKNFDPAERFTEQDVVLITYGDLLMQEGKAPLDALHDFLSVYMRGAISTVHVLPFFPSSSDRGFAIIDYEDVDPRLGTWDDIEELAGNFRLMFDGVFNHVSSKSRLFQRFLNGHPGYEDVVFAFSTKDAIHPDYLKLILRPRTSSLLTPFRTINGIRYVWTTFSPDQIDLNFRNERVLQRVVEILLYYVRRGADLIRLDAVTYIWRELGTSCVHLEGTHALVKLFRAILDVVAPHVALITETNVPHADNISYFGDGSDEAQMVYNFALPPLVMHAFHRADATTLSRWAASLNWISPTATYFNFLASHDGIGLLGARDILPDEEIRFLLDKCKEHGGLISYRDNGDGTTSPYEMNVTWWSAFNRDDAGEPLSLQVDRYMASRSIALVLQGVPGVYLPSLFGAKNDTQAALASHDNRAINRKTIQVEPLIELLSDRSSWVRQVATRFRRMLKRRAARPAFHPNSTQKVLDVGSNVFGVVRATRDDRDRVVALTNVTADAVTIEIPLEDVGSRARVWRDVLSRRLMHAKGAMLPVSLRPYDVIWLIPESRPSPRWVVVSDLDGTLLDEQTYDWQPAKPALDALDARDVPLVLSTSKSFAELEPLRQAMGHHGPFIVENGGAVYVPEGQLGEIPNARRQDGFDVIDLGTPYADLVAILRAAAAESGVRVRGFHEMDDDEVARLTGLPSAAAARARRREFDEPFLILDDAAEADVGRLRAAIEARGARMTCGGRFHHVLGHSDKASALAALVAFYRRAHGRVQVAVLGDALNDAPMLAAADEAIIIRSPRADAVRALVPGATITDTPGPAGWNAAVLALLAREE